MTKPLSKEYQSGFSDARTIIRSNIEFIRRKILDVEKTPGMSAQDIVVNAQNRERNAVLDEVLAAISSVQTPRYTR